MISRLSLGRPLDYLGVLLAKKSPLCKGLHRLWCRRRDLNSHAIARTAA